MKRFSLILLIWVFVPCTIYTQTLNLTIEETIEYINIILRQNNIFLTNHPNTKKDRRINTIFINSKDNRFGFGVATMYNDDNNRTREYLYLDLNSISISKQGFSIIVNGDSKYMYLSYQYYRHSNTHYINRFEIKFPNEITFNRFYNAFSYLLEHLQKDSNFSTTKDPFDEINFENIVPRIMISEILLIDENNNKRIDQNEKITLKVTLRNFSSFNAQNLVVEIKEIKGLKGLNYTQHNRLNILNSNKTEIIDIILHSNNELQTGEANFEIRVLNNNKEEITKKSVKIATFNSGPQEILISKLPDVDINIPKTSNIRRNIYAIVIGNEDYKSKQPSLSYEANVKYAVNDAKIFKEYLLKTFGVPNTNITYLTNATSAQIKQAINKVKQLPLVNPNAEIIFYFAGHGLPDDKTKEQYIIPVDVNSSNLSFGLKINEIESELSSNNPKQVLLILDACFSGAARNESLLSNRAVRVRPKENIIKGNSIILSASSNEEASKAYDEMQHGMFTYFLLKKIQETKGNVDLQTLFDFLHFNVREKSLLINNQFQTPTITKSPQIQNNLNEIKF